MFRQYSIVRRASSKQMIQSQSHTCVVPAVASRLHSEIGPQPRQQEQEQLLVLIRQQSTTTASRVRRRIKEDEGEQQFMTRLPKGPTWLPFSDRNGSLDYLMNQTDVRSFSTTSSSSSSSSSSASASTDSADVASSKKNDKNDAATKTSAKEEGKKESFEDTIHRMKGEQSESPSSSDSFFGKSHHPFLQRAADGWQAFQAELTKTWQDLLSTEQRKDINKKITLQHPTETTGGDAPYTGPVEIMVIDESERLTAWERMQKRLTEAPIIQDLLERSEQVYEKSGAKKIKQRVDEIREDAREAWETSQNPWVYRISSVYDTITAETAESIAVKELRVLDPAFTLDDWRRDVVENTLPQIMSWWLQGRINQLKPWLGEGVFKRLAAEMTARQKEGVQVDTHILGIMNSEIIAVEPDEVNKGSPIIMLHFMCQQINCVRKKSDGTIVEGAEDDIRANSYVAAFQREYDEQAGELNWKIVDFRFNGAIAYL